MDDGKVVQASEINDQYYVMHFCARQQWLYRVFIWLHLVYPTNTYGLKHPITNRLEGLIQGFNAREKIFLLLQKLNDSLIDGEGRERRDRLQHCGWIQKNEKI